MSYTLFKIKHPRAMGLGFGIDVDSHWLAVPWGKDWYVRSSKYEFPIYPSDIENDYVSVVEYLDVENPITFND